MVNANSLANKFLIYFNTIKYLKPLQVWGQVFFRFYRPKIKMLTASVPRQTKKSWILSIHKNASINENESMFLNKTYDISDPTIWNRTDIDKLWLYHLHYFDLLKAEHYSSWQQSFMHRWIMENPPPSGNGWEPYTISLRIVNWIKWLLIHDVRDTTILDSIATQANYLSRRLEIHILGNHLLANAKALIFAGLFFTGKKAKNWLKKGLRYFSREIKNQIYNDGGHCELSPMYHAIILEDLLDVINICNVYSIPISHHWITVVKKMYSWLKTMEHPDGHIALFNDATFNVASSSDELKQYAERLNICLEDKIKEYLDDSGFVRLRNHACVLIADIGKIGAYYQPGHAHADTLSFELSLNQQRLFVNSGISTYNDCAERLNQRSTRSHNTLVINEKNSSTVWKSFRVADRAEVKNIQFIKNTDEIIISASHNGYFKPYRIIHTRTWKLQNDQLVILDNVTGNGRHKISIYFHIHPDVTVSQLNDHMFLLAKDGIQRINIKVSHKMNVYPSTYHPEFNKSISNQKLVIEEYCTLPMEFKTIIYWKH